MVTNALLAANIAETLCFVNIVHKQFCLLVLFVSKYLNFCSRFIVLVTFINMLLNAIHVSLITLVFCNFGPKKS